MEQHITDGVLTAQMNNITNFSFLHGRAEEQLGDLLRTLEGRNKEIVCILDPPKLGVIKRSTLTDLGELFEFHAFILLYVFISASLSYRYITFNTFL